MKFNKEFGRPINDGADVEFAPVVFAPNPNVPSEEEYNAHEFYRMSIEPSETPPGKVVESVCYEVRDAKVVAVYTYKDAPAPTIKDFDDAMEEYLYAERAERGYTTREPDSYLTSSIQRWRQDAADWVAHRDAVMQYALDLINAVEAGIMQPPTIDQFIAGLPKIEWSFQ